MGEVYLAQHPRLPRRDALKLLPPDWSTDEEYRARFVREADLASTLWHPHIVGVHDRGEADGQLWISMDFVDGLDAARLLADRYPAGMPVDEVVRIVEAVGGGLDYAHKQGLLHRDVKPANIMLTHLDDDGEQRILLTDFGIARNLDDISGLTATNMTVGSVAYCAPEQLMGEEIDGRADQYALAATTYHLLTGAQLFPHSNPAVVISRHLNSPPPALADTRSELAALDPVLAVALAKQPDRRFPRCADFARALAERSRAPTTKPNPLSVTASAPAGYRREAAETVAREQNADAQYAEAGGRRRRWVMAATMLGVALLIAALLWVWQPWRSREEVNSELSNTTTPTTTQLASPSVAPPPPPPLPTTTSTTTTTTMTTPAHSLPVAVVGSSCRPESTPTVDADGVTVSCARIQFTDGYVWSRIPDLVTVPTTSPGAPISMPTDVEICTEQTGRSLTYCSNAISQATYEGDGRIPMG
jgi:serine/threonine-protein kinase